MRVVVLVYDEMPYLYLCADVPIYVCICYTGKHCSCSSVPWFTGHIIFGINTPLYECFDCTYDVCHWGVGVGVSDLFMMIWWEIICKILCSAVLALVLNQVALFFFDAVYIQYIFISNAWDLF